jgi:putative cell wall-binding protein
LTSSLQLFYEVTSTRTAGADADATAIDEFTTEFPGALTTTCTGVPHTVLLATDANFPDALSASYLEGQLGTGIFLTPTAALSTETLTAIQDFGISTVDVVGGVDSVSQNVINTLKALPVEQCGGQTPATPAATVAVNVIAGQTQYDTSQDVDTHILNAVVGTAAFPGAYGTAYNDTTSVGGNASASGPTTAVPTAIVASGAGFQDAMASSVVAYSKHFPVVLTDPSALSSQATATLTNLNIKQVIVVGGPESVSAADVTAIEAEGISVLRIAGQDATTRRSCWQPSS